MATQSVSTPLPNGVGRPGVRSFLLFLVFALLIAAGGVAWSQQLTEGEIVTGLGDIGNRGGVAWGLYIVMDLYFVGMAFTGLALAAFVRVLHLDHLQPVVRLGLALTVVSLVMSMLMVIADLGRPAAGVVNLLLYARPGSPFFGTFAIVIVAELVAAAVYLYLSGRRDAATLAATGKGPSWLYRLWAAGYRDTPAERSRHRAMSGTLAWILIPLIIVAYSTLGLVFGLQPGRPGWFSALQAPSLVVLGASSGLGMIALLAAITRSGLRLQSRIPKTTFAWIGNTMLTLGLVSGYFMVIEYLVAIFAKNPREARVTDAVIADPYAWIFWLTVGLLLMGLSILLIQTLAKQYSIPLIALAGVLINAATIGKRYVTVVPSQTHGSILPYEPGSYAPSGVEYLVVLGVLALGALLFLLFLKVFPITDVADVAEGSSA